MILKRQRNIAIVFIMLMMWMPESVAARELKYEKLPDKVEHWYYAKSDKSRFSELLENVCNAVINRQPFGKSVAFLVGVSRYEHISPQLDFVRNDLKLLREFLLSRGGFDEVYVAADQVADAELVQNYMSNNRMNLKEDDRLLFYYSGHGADIGGRTGYIQFSDAVPGRRDVNNYLAIRECEEWSRMLRIRHILFIYDCCVSGLAFTAKSGGSDSEEKILTTLKSMSGNGSRTVITAGTAEEKTFGVENHSVFTKAFLDALNTSQNINGFMTMNEVFAQIERRVKDFSRQYDKKITPRRWELEEDKYRGTFLFVDSSAQNIELPDEYREPLKVKATPKGEVVDVVGIIQLSSYVNGEVYIDGQKAGEVENGKILKFYDIPADKPHRLEVRTGKKIYAFDDVGVEKGKITPVRIDPDEAVVPPTPPKKTEPASVKPVQPQAQTSKYQLRSKPITVSDDEFKKVFRLDEKTWRPLEYIQNDFNDNGDGTITDHATGLMWQKSGSPDQIYLKDVPAYIQKLNSEKFAGYSDWRLPTVDELKSLITREKQPNDLYINPIFEKKDYNWFWTSDKRASGGAWLVDFDVGGVSWLSDYNSCVRAVRLRQ